MKKTIRIVLASFLMLAMPFNINTYAAAETSTEQMHIEADTVGESSEADQQAEHNIEYKFEEDFPSDENDEGDSEDSLNYIAPTTEYVPVEEIELGEYKDEMYVKESQSISATVYPVTASGKNIQYSTSDSSVATITASGKLTAVGSGNCRVYAECDGDGEVVVERPEFAEYSGENGGGKADTDGVCGAGWTSASVGRLFAV